MEIAAPALLEYLLFQLAAGAAVFVFLYLKNYRKNKRLHHWPDIRVDPHLFDNEPLPSTFRGRNSAA